MLWKPELRYREADQRRGVILLSVAIICSILAWLGSNSSLFLGAVCLVAAYLLTGNRYHWIYIWKKTFIRDCIGLYVIGKTLTTIGLWEKSGVTVLTRFAGFVRLQPDKNALVMGDRALTYKQGDELSNRIARYFKGKDYKPGSVVALYMETQPEYVFIWLGLAKIRVVSALVNSNLKGSQLIHCLKIAGCNACIFGDEMAEAIKEIQQELPDLPFYQFNSPDRPTTPVLSKTIPLHSELQNISGETVEVIPAKSRDILMYIYTSGTTGFPKAAIITNIRYLLIPLGAHTSARLSSNDVIYNPLPLHHTAGGVLGAGQCLALGCTVVLRKKFSATNYWSEAGKHGCTVAQYIGEMCRYLLSTPPSPSDRSHTVTTILGNGLRPQIWQEFINRFNVKRVFEFYGATEGNSVLINLDSHCGAIGFLSRPVLSFYPLLLVRCDQTTGEIRRDGHGRCVRCVPNEAGLLLGKIDPRKAITSFAGYADKTATEKKMVRNVLSEGDCYFNTGDIVIMDHLGYVYFKDRTGDTFRWRGENVSTAEVEGVITTLVGLKDVIVYGVAIPSVEGKAGMAAISDPEAQLDLTTIVQGLKQNLAPYAIPLFIRVIPEPPLTATFKLKKKELIEEGFDPKSIQDKIYFLDSKKGEYVELTETLYEDLMEGRIRL